MLCTIIKLRSHLVKDKLLVINRMAYTGTVWSVSLQVFLQVLNVNTVHRLHVLFFRSYLGDSCKFCAEFTQFCALIGLHKHVKFWFQLSSGCIEKHSRKFNWMCLKKKNFILDQNKMLLLIPTNYTVPTYVQEVLVICHPYITDILSYKLCSLPRFIWGLAKCYV